MEHVVVSYPENRKVHVDGVLMGRTNEVLALTAGAHVFSLSGLKDYDPAKINSVVVDTQPIEPLVIRFVPLEEVAEKAQLDERKSLQPSAPAIDRNRQFVFVAMPFAKAFTDVFHYGIRAAADHAGFIAVRIDEEVFTGDIMVKVKDQIAQSALVIADLSTSNPNVYLEVGYAWGIGKQTVLIVNDQSDVKFDLGGQRYLKYTTIQSLEETLTKELKALASLMEGRSAQHADT